ncbi:MAG: hypothetical protein GY842_08550 [bacterium]|nr:hypothetical protein [bacterium]
MTEHRDGRATAYGSSRLGAVSAPRTRLGIQSFCIALAMAGLLVAGCGTGATDGGAGGVATLGPRPVSGAPTEDQADDTTPTDSSQSSDEDEGNDEPEDEADPDDSSDDGVGSVDACVAISGRTFFWPNGNAPIASLSFVEGRFIWTNASAQTEGNYQCSSLDVEGLTDAGLGIQGQYNPDDDEVVWDGVTYRPRQLQ